MPVYEETAYEDKPPLPDREIFKLEVLEIEEKESNFTDEDGKPQKRLSFKFKVIEEGTFADDNGEIWPLEGRWVWGETPTTWSQSDKCKLRQWAQEILNVRYPAGPLPPLDTDHLVGRTCRGLIEQYTTKAGRRGCKVADVLRDKESAPAYAEEF